MRVVVKKLLLTLALLLAPTLAFGQCNGVFPNNTICGNVSGAAALPKPTSNSVLTGVPAGTLGQTQFNNGGVFGGYTPSGDCTVATGTGVFTCLKTNGVNYGPFATANATSATATLNLFTSTLQGLVPSSGGGITNYLRADGTFTNPIQVSYAVNAANVSGSFSSTTGTITSGTNTLTLTSALDFKNGQGIRINHAGAATTATAPGTGTATPVGTAGTTIYTYAVYAFDSSGGVSPAGANFTTATGNATLSTTNYVSLSWGASTGAVGYAIYGRVGGSLTLIGVTQNTAFYDYGSSSYYGVPTAYDWLSSTPPTGTLARWLITTISSGGGTTSLTLAANASTTATTQGIYHDDTTALQAAITAAQSAGQSLDLSGGAFRISSALTTICPFTLQGSGMSDGVLSSIILTNPMQDGIDTTSGNYCNFHGFTLWGGSRSSSGQISGTGISFASSGGHSIYNIGSQYLFSVLNLNNGPYYVYNNLISGYGNIINSPTFNDSWVAGNSISPIYVPNNSSGGIGINIGGDPGGAKIIGNKINSGIGAYRVGMQIIASVADGDVIIANNSIEGWTLNGILMDRIGAITFANWQILGNQIAGGQGNASSRGIYSPSAAAWPNNVVINDNVIQATLTGIDIQGAVGINFTGNIITGSTNGINLGVGVTGCGFGLNNFPSVTTQITNTNACTFTAVTTTKPTYP